MSLATLLETEVDRPDLLGRLEARVAHKFTSAPRQGALIALLGPPGIGKTWLARRYLATQRHVPPERALFCDLSHSNDVDDLVANVADALRVGVADGGLDVGSEDLIGRTLERQAPTLLVLDNVEQLVEAAAGVLARWQARAPAVCFIVTSRVALRVAAEQRLEVGPLALPQARALFEARVRAVRGEPFSLGPPDDAVVDRLLRCLDCMPLAIELAAAQASVMTPAQLLARLERVETAALEPLGLRDAAVQHASLERAIAGSWALLDEPARAACAQLSVFRGGFDLEAAESVLRFADASVPVPSVLQQLLESSLLRRTPSPHVPEALRFTCYESVRAFASRALHERGELEGTRQRHADYFIRSGLEWRGRPAPQVKARLLLELGNFMAVHRWAEAHDPARNARILLVLTEVVHILGGFERHTRALRRAADQCQEPELEAQLRVGAASMLFLAGRPRECLEELERTAAVVDPMASPSIRLRWALCRDSADRVLGKGNLAGWLERALDLTRQEASPHLEGVLLAFIGHHRWMMGDVAGGERWLEDAERFTRRHGQKSNHARVLSFLGMVRMEQDRSAEADEMYAAALDYHTANDELVPMARLRLLRMLAAYWSGDAEATLAHAETTLDSARQLGEVWVEAVALCIASLTWTLRGECQLARTLLDDAASLVQAVCDGFAEEVWVVADAALALAHASQRGEPGAKRAAPLPHWLDALQIQPDDVRGTHLPVRLLGPLWARARQHLAPGAPTASAPSALIVGPQTRWFQLPSGERVDISRRQAPRAILRALLEARRQAPGDLLTREALQELGWPGEQMRPDSATKRVHVAIWTLRRLGLGNIIETVEGTYRIAPAVRLIDDPSPV